MINRVVLVGRLTRDTELRYTTSGKAVGTFSLAVNRQFTNASGEREADFINCVIWSKGAENFANFTGKGAQVAVEGRLQTRNYENQQGQRVYVTEVVVDNFSLLESRAESEQRRQSQGEAPQAQQNNGNVFSQPSQQNATGAQNTGGHNPFNAPKNNDPFGGGQEVDITDDDLPF
ncbi:single-stranded DNA-binding protein [Weissella tructae]|uniref:single-stranded DNA-binding protein n=1 Tax=Weissella tructae TaxID=887702 RepID=UPI003D93C615